MDVSIGSGTVVDFLPQELGVGRSSKLRAKVLMEAFHVGWHLCA
jgi:hypothetical protein